MTKPENMYETPNIPTNQKDFEKLQRKVVFALVWLAIVTLVAIVAVGVAVYAATRDLESNDQGTSQASNNGMAPDGVSDSEAPCSQGRCENGGSCVNIPPNNYICACVATFYGRNCQHGEYIFTRYSFWSGKEIRSTLSVLEDF